MAVAVYDRLNQLEDALRYTSKLGQSGHVAAHGKSGRSGMIARLKSAWSGVRHFRVQQPTRWYQNPYILYIVIVCLMYFVLSIFSWQQWHYYRTENTHLRLTADKYHVDSIILREVYPQATITLSAYEHITESKGADAAINIFRENTYAVTE